MTVSVFVIGRLALLKSLRSSYRRGPGDPEEHLDVSAPAHTRESGPLRVEDQMITKDSLNLQLRRFSGLTANPVTNSLKMWLTKADKKRAVIVDVRGVSDAIAFLEIAATAVRGTSTAVIAIQPEIGLSGDEKSDLLRAGADLTVDPAEATSGAIANLTESYVEATEAEKQGDRNVERLLIRNSLLLSLFLGVGSGLSSGLCNWLISKNAGVQSAPEASWSCEFVAGDPKLALTAILNNKSPSRLHVYVLSSFGKESSILLNAFEAKTITFARPDLTQQHWLRLVGPGHHSHFLWAAAPETLHNTSQEGQETDDSPPQSRENM